MRLKSITWKNVGPYGNKIQSIEFPEKGGLWMVNGKNGNGKSFFINIPKILYYGKLDKFKKDEIANRLNKHAWIKGEIAISSNSIVEIERKISPTDLIVKKDGEDIGKAGISNYQNYIDNEVTGLPYHIFSNIISLSVNDFKSFISMTPYDKRIIIDKLFAMEVINKMNDLVKSDIRDVRINMQLFDREIVSLKHNIDTAVKELDKLKKKVNTDNTKRIGEISAKLLEFKPKLEDGYNKKKEYTKKKAEITEAYNVFIVKKNTLTRDISEINKQINLYTQDKCPTCSTPFSESRFDLLKEELTRQIEEKKIELETVIAGEKSYSVAFTKLNDGIDKINHFIIQYESTFKTLQLELVNLQKEKPTEFKSIQNIIESNSKKLNSKETDKVEFDDDFRYLSILEEVYSDTGVKKKILESYLPTLNSEIAYTLGELHFPYSLEFNSDFEPILNHLGAEISVDTLSTGEKKRVDLAVLISIIRMLKRKYPDLNIFMLDEVLSSIDGEGIYDIIGLLQKISKELRMNIFIINHSPLPIEHFDFTVTVDKVGGFSDLEITDLERAE